MSQHNISWGKSGDTHFPDNFIGPVSKNLFRTLTKGFNATFHIACYNRYRFFFAVIHFTGPFSLLITHNGVPLIGYTGIMAENLVTVPSAINGKGQEKLLQKG